MNMRLVFWGMPRKKGLKESALSASARLNPTGAYNPASNAVPFWRKNAYKQFEWLIPKTRLSTSKRVIRLFNVGATTKLRFQAVLG